MDYSFIRLEDTFIKAKQIKNSPVSSIYNNQIIQLLPDEQYLQITNTDFGISFDGDYSAYLVDCEGKELANITNNVAIFEFIDNKGINQIAFELYKLPFDFYKQSVYLKLVHTTGTDVYYSNPFTISNYQKHKTTRFDYRNNVDLKGISYDKVYFYQSIRLQAWFTNYEDKTDISDYFQISNGNTISNRPLIRQLENYSVDFMTNFVYKRVNLMLCHDVIYIDGVRMTNKTTLKSGKMDGDANTFKTDFSIYKNNNEKYYAIPFIFNPLFFVSGTPLGDYTLASLPNKIKGIFSRDIFKLTGNVRLFKNGVLINTFDQNQINILGAIFEIDITGIIFENADYSIKVDAGLFTDYSDLNIDLVWFFKVKDGEYEKTEYDNNEYLIN